MIHPWASPFYRLHRYYYAGITLGLVAARLLHLRFHTLRDLMIAVDVLLSAMLWTGLIGSPPAAAFALAGGGILPAAVCLVLVVASLLLLRVERRLARRYWAKSLVLYNVDTGSASTLRGRVVVGHLFVNEGDRFWTAAGMDRAMETAQEATRWLEFQARSYGAELGVENLSLGATHPGPRVPLCGLPERVMREALAFASEARAADGACLVLHPADLERSHARPDYLGCRRPEPVELCLVRWDAPPSVVAHELLHLFGGDDHYHSTSIVERDAKRELIGRSIMFESDAPLERLVVDGVTAQCVGWS